MPTVLLINECLDFSTGGIARQIGETAIKHGWESYIAYSARESYYPTLCHTYAIGSKGEFYLHALETRLLDNHGLASRCATKRLIKRIGEIHPDVIHLHNIHGYYLNYEALFAYLNTAKIPVVWTLHDCWTFTGHCAHFEPIGCFKWQNKCERCALKNEYPKSWFVDRSERNYTRKKAAFTSIEKVTIVPVSRWLSKFLPYSFLSRFPFRVINNGIDLDIFKPSGDNLYVAYKEKGKIILLGVTNRWEGSKGLDDFIKLGLDDRFQVVLVGSCAGIRKSLPKTILTMGYVQDQKELAGIYSSADVFVNPTYADTFPTVNIESIACGTPVVTYQTGGSPEIIDERTGYVAKQGDYNDLVNGILQIANQSPSGKSLQRQRCRARAEALYNKDDRYAEYIELYNSLVKK